MRCDSGAYCCNGGFMSNENLKEECKSDILNFLQEYKTYSINGCSTMYSGWVNCIKPVPTICGAELMCNFDTIASLKDYIRCITNE